MYSKYKKRIAINETLAQLGKQNYQLKQELGSLAQEIFDAHEMLTEKGIGKEHWSLAGRIELMHDKLAGQGFYKMPKGDNNE